VLRDQREHAVGGATCEPHQRFAVLASVASNEIIGIVLQAGNHLAAIAARRAVTDLLRLQHDHAAARLGERERACEPGVARTDDREIRFDAFLE